ncbi:di-heme oxidoredictase family protein [Aestuariispira ectoiniformans]|uniref:di-heme oxidoredictase family protein n=1 Tax=Aestuariispira ectoiniformans TaxID=2775080 RepID=UPI00223B4D3D|nr:di-heme oxidoredictase family protein [Aestuariispira ectoiniformans]
MRWFAILFLFLIAAKAAATDLPDAFGRARDGLTVKQQAIFAKGRAVFNRDWVPYPGYRDDLDGLGPLFNRVSCSGCHFANGRGRPPQTEDEPFISMVLRVHMESSRSRKMHPVYGGQVNDRALPTVPAEGAPHVSYHEQAGRYPDGADYSLQVPTYRVEGGAYGPLDNAVFSPRVAPQFAGVGLLARVPAKVVEALADPDDRDGDGISGRVRYIGKGGVEYIGRFGWKAAQPTIRDQTVSALYEDIGITSAAHSRQNCLPSQTACRLSAAQEGPEISEDDLSHLVSYQMWLMPPTAGTTSVEGRAAFEAAGCDACHRPALPLEDGGTAAAFTDLLLHDMGDGLSDGGANILSREWRTAPLWGIGHIAQVNGHTRLLHDGRARNVEEAILWHGGEAQASKEAFMRLPSMDRKAVIEFIEGL